VTSPSVTVLDYGSGNLRSVVRALERAGSDVTLTADRTKAMDADGLVVPGVGAFASCMAGLRAVRGHEVIGRRLAGGRPVLGICVGMQILFERGVEHGVETAGCDEWPGVVERLQAPVVPHMGWNTVEAPEGTTLFAGVEDERFYFVHSYGVRDWSLVIR
jgi:glutamine amidotransferase